MAQLNFGGTTETVVIRDEFPLEKAREVLKNETIAVIGYGVQGPGQALNLRDNGFNVIVGQREGKTYDKAVADGWVPGETLFGIEEACERGTIVMCLLSDAAVMSVWPTIKPYLTAGKALYFSHGFAITWNDRTGVVPPADIDVIMVAPKGSGTSLRTMFLEGRGLNSSYAIYQDATGKAYERTTFTCQVRSSLTLESCFEQITGTDTNTQCDGSFVSLACSILIDSIRRVQAASFEEHSTQRCTRTFRSNHDNVDISRKN